MGALKGKVMLAKPRGFCSGVEKALAAVEKALAEGPWPVCVLHEIVHNEHVVESLERRGVRFVSSPSEAPEGATLVFSAHGVSKETERQAQALKLAIVDASCPLVKRLHEKAEGFERQGYRLILIGHKGHREVEGVLGRLEKPAAVVGSAKEADAIPETDGPCACLSQTTLCADEVEEIARRLKKRLPGLVAASSVCYATKERQEAVKRLAAVCETILVVGSSKSSNSKRLRETAEACGAKAFLIASAKDLEGSMLEGASSVGVTAGASAPETLVEELLEALKRKGFALVEDEP